uniref:Transmembrane protein n=1 Tax=Alexandrium catenella TaxID=2925 RepID=A0A7S1L616_ALECA|mmetsp:Transcript_106924/g.284507  ORF Transcript_106924/g.284507 Transcript_106924/m.284507 type:complete len:232 (+) Transcript_106924:66-761(+)|eukprot:CAMPEP_0171229032 /NCGR_PEP_ID=MMETSP0790-20130122/38670_1 /TAXON_ID=2925 /ORGANISM="Alexandrium catenella, Strain OF101" /LENGTH=231 /DNA_ID=CAMNT_0011695197 /DNA_START=71 /DNA_END=766 /DNA_ORIENTATION=+
MRINSRTHSAAPVILALFLPYPVLCQNGDSAKLFHGQSTVVDGSGLMHDAFAELEDEFDQVKTEAITLGNIGQTEQDALDTLVDLDSYSTQVPRKPILMRNDEHGQRESLDAHDASFGQAPMLMEGNAKKMAKTLLLAMSLAFAAFAVMRSGPQVTHELHDGEKEEPLQQYSCLSPKWQNSILASELTAEYAGLPLLQLQELEEAIARASEEESSKIDWQRGVDATDGLSD